MGWHSCLTCFHFVAVKHKPLYFFVVSHHWNTAVGKSWVYFSYGKIQVRKGGNMRNGKISRHGLQGQLTDVGKDFSWHVIQQSIVVAFIPRPMTSLVTGILFKFSTPGVNFPPLGGLKSNEKIGSTHDQSVTLRLCSWQILPLASIARHVGSTAE